VAKIDGYVISVGGGGPLVGSKVLVRIEEAGRTSARATVIGEPEALAADGSENGAEAVDSKPRRRGRRGGRRRSSAAAKAPASE
jgi:ribonuclease G